MSDVTEMSVAGMESKLQSELINKPSPDGSTSLFMVHSLG